MGWGDFLDAGYHYLREAVEDKVGYTMVPRERVELLEATAVEAGALRRDMDLLGYSTLDFLSGSPHEVRQKKRVDAVRQARIAWMYDPMAGSAVSLINEFVFGRGVPPPTARDDEVQKVIDDAWDDADNVAVLTGYQAQAALGTDLQLQSNLFVLFFADGDDGKVKLSLLDHDTVHDAVRDPENRMRTLYYVAQHTEMEWDFETDTLKPVEVKTNVNERNLKYYAHWKNVKDAELDYAAGLRDKPPPKPPANKLGDGVVYHITLNRTTEMVFGVPEMQRTMRWFSAYNDLMSSRVDMAKAAAELIMKRKVKASSTALGKLAQGMIGRGGEIATAPDPTRLGGRPASTVVENENVTHEKFNLDSGAANATQDATAIRSQVSAGVRLPQHYLGDQGNANLATATAMDVPVTKMVEARQELFEQLFRAFTDMVIQRAVETGRLKGDLPGEQSDAEVPDPSSIGEVAMARRIVRVARMAREAASQPGAKIKLPADTGNTSTATGDGNGNGRKSVNGAKKLDGSPDNAGKKKDGKTDLSYEFKMPNPLRRLMSDLATTISTIAKTFDPNGTNVELGRVLLTVALGEALELQDPADAVGRIFPDGYQDPLVKMELAAGAAAAVPPDAGAQPQDTTGGGSGGTQAVGGEPGSGKEGPYGTKSQGTRPEQMQQAEFESMVDAAVALVETRYHDMTPEERAASEGRLVGMAEEFDLIVGRVADAVAERVPALTGGSSTG